LQKENELAEAAFAVLLEGARSQRTDPDVMHGALVYLDMAATKEELPEQYAVNVDAVLERDYRLIFSTAMAFKPWRYMPVKVHTPLQCTATKNFNR
jgi:hypothetical protein